MATIKPHRTAAGEVTYRVRFRLSPGTNPVNETFSTLDDAREFASLVDAIGGAAAREVRSKVDSPVRFKTLQVALDEYCDHVDSYAARGTAPEYRRLASRTWLARLGAGTPIQAVTVQAVEKWLAWQRQQPTRRGTPYSAKSLRNAQGLLSSVLDYQVKIGGLERNVAVGMKIPKDSEKREKVYLTGNQFAVLVSKFPVFYQPMIIFMYATGMRWGEVTALRASDFDLDGTPPTVRVSRAWKRGNSGGDSYLGSPKSSRSVRTITLPLAVVRELRPLIEESTGGDNFVFHAVTDPAKAIHYSHFLERVWRPAVTAANLGVTVTPHDLRHSHASALIGQGVPLPVIQRRLGHESIKTTVDVYGHLAPDSYAGAAEAIGLVMSPALPQLEG